MEVAKILVSHDMTTRAHTAVQIYQYNEGASCHNLCTAQCHIPEDNNLRFKYPFNAASLSYKQK